MSIRLDRNFFQRLLVRFFVGIYLACLGGCASTPAPLAPEHRLQLGRIGLLALPSTPSIEFHTFAKGWAAGAAKGGALGVAQGLVHSMTEAIQHQPTGVYAEPTILITTLVLTTVSSVIYGVVGGLESVPVKTARQIEQELNAALGNVNLAKDLVKAIHAAAARPDLVRYDVSQLNESPSGTAPTFIELGKQGIDTVVEVQFTEAGFRGGSGGQPKVSFYMNARIRLVATPNGAEIYTRDFQYLGRERPFVEWFSDGSRELLSGFKQAMVTLADRIVDELFLVTEFPFDSGLWALPGQPEFGSCWLRPIYPELNYSSLWDALRTNTPGTQIRYTNVDSLQPLLQWESFPRSRDRKPENMPLLNQISDVSYDVKIWEASSDYPERLVHDIRGLDAPQLRFDLPLKPSAKYFWTFRARYKLAGEVQLTRWAFSNIPSNAPADYPQRPAGGACNLDAIPSTNYYRFVTP